jgi:hypothetical protein
MISAASTSPARAGASGLPPLVSTRVLGIVSKYLRF